MQKGLVLTATERLSLPPISLELGGIEETVRVDASSIRVQTQSGERSAVITAAEIENIGLRGRDFMGTLKLLPGVVDTSARDAPGWGSVGGMTINGMAQFNFSYDGVTNKDTGSNSGNYAAPALDSIAEVKVQASNFQAEYGRTSGATIVVVTKSGSKQFSGTAAYFRRNEDYNTNTWERRQACNTATAAGGTSTSCAKPRYRYDNTAYTIGGPVLIPGTSFNSNRDRLFFFWSQDILPRNDPGGLQNSTMPTELERAGNFSQTVGTNGNRIWIKDPLLAAQGLACNANTGGPGCFPNNIIPANRINAHRRVDPQPLPDAERHRPVGHPAVQLSVRRQHRKTQARPGAAGSTGTLFREGRRSPHACSSGTKSVLAATSQPAASICSCRATGRRCRTHTTSTPSAPRTPCSIPSTRRPFSRRRWV